LLAAAKREARAEPGRARSPGGLASAERAASAAANPLWSGFALGAGPRLAVSRPDDPSEVEAERVADRIMRLPGTAMQRSCAARAAGPTPSAESELSVVHTLQTGRTSTVYRSVVAAGEAGETAPGGEGEYRPREYVAPEPPARAATIPSPESCPPPEEMRCPPAIDSPGAVTNTLIFPVNSATLTTLQRAEIDHAAAAWHAAGGAVGVRVDGYASAEGACVYNWDLSCRRARAVATELESPSDGTAGVPGSDIDVFAHGESAEAGRALAPNRKATISIPAAPPPPPAPSPPACAFPVLLGSARGCGSGTDFTHFDFPSISASSEAKLSAWAAGHPPVGMRPLRSLITDTECELEMDGVLVGLAGSAGHAAFARFSAGTGGTVTHGTGSTLGSMALASGSFLATVAAVQADIETQLAAQATAGLLDPCALSVTPPATHFGFSDGVALKAVIGGTQGEELFATGFTGDVTLRSYSIDLRFDICDDFGVDESDLYAPGLFPFWVLQHERSATRYAPFINQLELPVTVSGTF
jgi:outer membrane protein OmpA-like peptidoglycan-associated protein